MILPVNELPLIHTTRIGVVSRSPTLFETILILLELPRDPQRSKSIEVEPKLQGRSLPIRYAKFEWNDSNRGPSGWVPSSSVTKQGSASVFQKKDQVKFVGGALLQFRNQVKVEVAGHGALRVDQESPTTNVIAER